MRRAGLLAVAMSVAGCATTPDLPREVSDAVPGTTETVVSVLVPGFDGGSSFYMTRTEITWELYDIFVYRRDLSGSARRAVDAEARPSRPYVLPGEGFGHNGHPALAMTSKGATAFAAWLSEKTGQAYRLPTEAEWAHACRGGEKAPPDPLGDYAWYWDNADDRTGAAGTREPNAYGLHDMLGNVAEYALAEDGTAVIRGGSYRTDAAELSCAWRQGYRPGWNASDPQFPKSAWWYVDAPFLGFRLIREVSDAQ